MASILSNGKHAIAGFVHESLLPLITEAGCPTKINVARLFSEYLCSKGVNESLADEHAEKWAPQLNMRIYDEISEWELLGLPRPIELHNSSSTFVTCRHEKYREITGFEPLPIEFSDIFEWIGKQSERNYLFVCVCFLKLLGASEIFITDASGDGGIDLVGKLSLGPLRSCCFFVQSKSSNRWINRETVLLEYGKFCAMMRSGIFADYQNTLSMNQSVDGATLVYLFIANNEFQRSARQVSLDLGILLRSRRQIAFWLSAVTTLPKLKAERVKLGEELEKDLSKNLAELIDL